MAGLDGKGGALWGDTWPAIQAEQYHGALLQFAVVCRLSVHFLWKKVLHLLQDSSWSFGREAEGFIGALQAPQENVDS